MSNKAAMLRERLKTLDTDAGRVKHRMRKAAESQKSEHSRPCSAGQRRCARALMALHGGEPTAALRFLATAPNKNKNLDMHKEAGALTTWWLGSSPQERNRLATEGDGLTAAEQTALARARNFLLESNLEAWVEKAKRTEGYNTT